MQQIITHISKPVITQISVENHEAVPQQPQIQRQIGNDDVSRRSVPSLPPLMAVDQGALLDAAATVSQRQAAAAAAMAVASGTAEVPSTFPSPGSLGAAAVNSVFTPPGSLGEAA